MSVAFKFTKTGQMVCLEKIHQPKPKEKELFENYLTGVCRIFIMINSLSLLIFTNTGKIIFKLELGGLKLGTVSLKLPNTC